MQLRILLVAVAIACAGSAAAETPEIVACAHRAGVEPSGDVELTPCAPGEGFDEDFQCWSATVDASLCDVLAVIRDVPCQSEWIYRCTGGTVYRERGPYSQDIYVRFAGTYPVRSRDAFVATEVEVKVPGQRIDVTFHEVEEPIAVPDDFARMKTLTGEYRLTWLAEKGVTQVEYRIKMDLNATFLERVLAAVFNRDAPAATLRELIGRVGVTRGSYAAKIESWPDVSGKDPCTVE